MGGRVLGEFPQVVPAGNDFAPVHHHGPNGDFAPRLGPSGLFESSVHEAEIGVVRFVVVRFVVGARAIAGTRYF